jgi:protein gp37
MQKTGIEYLTHTWNPIAMRCDPVSEGCANCWHLAFTKRHAENPHFSIDQREAYGGEKPILVEKELDAPSRLRKPGRIGVQFMGDLFHAKVPGEWIERILNAASVPRHSFFFLTKRPQRLVEQFFYNRYKWYVGVTIEDQGTADQRLPYLLDCHTPMVRFISVEPLLGPVDLSDYLTGAIDWVIIGCETGPRRRPSKLEWVESLIDQADDAGEIPVFVKQLDLTENYPDHQKVSFNPEDWPRWAQRREWPETKS